MPSTVKPALKQAPNSPSTFRNYTPPEPRFRALLTEGGNRVNFD